jgi:putative transposase
MSRYRRIHVTGGTVFFTVCLAERGSDLLVREIDLLRWSVGRTLQEHPVQVLAWVVLPDHMHAIWQLPSGDRDYARRWGAIKGRFSRALAESGHSPDLQAGRCAGARPARGEVGLWQKRFWEHHLCGTSDLDRHLDLCRGAPVEAGLVQCAEDWPFSSFSRARRLTQMVQAV